MVQAFGGGLLGRVGVLPPWPPRGGNCLIFSLLRVGVGALVQQLQHGFVVVNDQQQALLLYGLSQQLKKLFGGQGGQLAGIGLAGQPAEQG